MNEGLQQITDWSDRAAAALWCVAGLAEGSHVSIATLNPAARRGRPGGGREGLEVFIGSGAP